MSYHCGRLQGTLKQAGDAVHHCPAGQARDNHQRYWCAHEITTQQSLRQSQTHIQN